MNDEESTSGSSVSSHINNSIDVGETVVSLPSITKINEELTLVLKDWVKRYVTVVLDSISADHQISRDLLQRTYLTDEMIERYCGTPEVKNKKNRKKLESDDQCWAMTANRTRCSRKHKEGDRFCGSHISMNPEEYVESPDSSPEIYPSKKPVFLLKK